MIADNHMTLYPYWRNTLLNTNTKNESWTYSMGIHDRKSLVKTPDVRSIVESFDYYNEKNLEEDVKNE